MINDFSYFLFVTHTDLFPNLKIQIILLALPFLAIFFMTILSLLILISFTIIGFYYHVLSSITDKNNCNYYCELLILNLIIFIIGIFGVALNSIKMYKISPLYALLYPIGSLFLVIAYLSSIIPLILSIRKKSAIKTIEWK